MLQKGGDKSLLQKNDKPFPGRVESAIRALAWVIDSNECHSGTMPRVDDRLFTEGAIKILLGRLCPCPEYITHTTDARAFIAHVIAGKCLYTWQPTRPFIDNMPDLTLEECDDLDELLEQTVRLIQVHNVYELATSLLAELFLT